MRQLLRASVGLAVLFASANSMAGGFKPAERLYGRWGALRSGNYQQNFVRHRNGLGEMSPLASDLDRKDGSFRVVPGLAGPGTVSLESFNFPGSFLRHQNGRIKLDRFDASDLFRKDASFVIQPGAAGDGTTFRASNYPEHAIRHCSGHLFIDRNDKSNPACDPNDAVFRGDISFHVERAPSVRTISLQSVNYPDHFVRHCSGLGFIDNNVKGNAACNPAVYEEDISFVMVSGLAGRGVSFESTNYPGQYLRHQGGRLKLGASDSSELFKSDASFEQVAGLAGRETSFRSVNYPDRFIRHCSSKLYIDKNDGSNKDCDPTDAVFRNDVTFKVVPGR